MLDQPRVRILLLSNLPRIRESFEADERADVIVLHGSSSLSELVAAIAELRELAPAARILAVTTSEGSEWVREPLRAGAAGCVLTGASAEQFLNAIGVVAAGGLYVDAHLAPDVLEGLFNSASANGHDRRLSAREADVMRLVAAGYGNKEIASRLSISVKTVETHKMRAIEKLHLHSRADIVRYAIAHHWLAGTDPHRDR